MEGTKDDALRRKNFFTWAIMNPLKTNSVAILLYPMARPCVALFVFLGILGSSWGRADTAKPPLSAARKPFEVLEVHDLSYNETRDSDLSRFKLDLFLPREKKDFPVMLLVHGGAWTLGDKSFFGWGQEIATYFAGQGIGVVIPNYGLAPAVKNPQQIEDVARAFSWTCRNIRKYGGNPNQLFLCGHSAGGQLVSLLATDPSPLKVVGLEMATVKGVISVSGVYRVPEMDLNVSLGSAWINTDLTLPEGFPFQGVRLNLKKDSPVKPSGHFSMRINPFRDVFGDDPKALHDAAPLSWIKPGLPPFLVIYADHDLPTLGDMAQEFAKTLNGSKDDVKIFKVDNRDHESVMFNARTGDDPVAQAIEKFIGAHLSPN